MTPTPDEEVFVASRRREDSMLSRELKKAFSESWSPLLEAFFLLPDPSMVVLLMVELLGWMTVPV
jgi:hypothetical protein